MVGRKQGARGLFLGLALAVVSLAASPSISRAEPQDTISRTAQNLAPAVISPAQPGVASQPAVQSAVLAPEAGSATAASGLPPEQVEAIMRTQSCLAQLGFYQGEIDGKRGSETWTAYWHFKKQHGLKAHSDFLAKPVQTKLAALCKEKPKKAVAALDPAKQPSLLPEAAVVPEAPASTVEETPSAAPARLEMGCLPDDLRALLPPSRAAAARRCSGACMPPPKGFSQSLLDELQARSGVVWCRACLAIDGRLTLADVQNIERKGNVELCATPPRQVPRHMSGGADTSYTRIREFYRSLPPVPEDEETVAVVIGNRNYAKLPPSETSANDAGAVYAILTDILNAEVTREPTALRREPGAVHHDRAGVVVTRGVADDPQAVAAVGDARRGRRGGARAAVPVEDDDLHLTSREVGLRGHVAARGGLRRRRLGGDHLRHPRLRGGCGGLRPGQQRAADHDQEDRSRPPRRRPRLESRCASGRTATSTRSSRAGDPRVTGSPVPRLLLLGGGVRLGDPGVERDRRGEAQLLAAARDVSSTLRWASPRGADRGRPEHRRRPPARTGDGARRPRSRSPCRR